jgi:hypothetical protein
MVGAGTTEGDPEHPFLKGLMERESSLTVRIMEYYKKYHQTTRLFVEVAGDKILLYNGFDTERGLASKIEEDEFKFQQKEEKRYKAKSREETLISMMFCVRSMIEKGYNVRPVVDGVEYRLRNKNFVDVRTGKRFEYEFDSQPDVKVNPVVRLWQYLSKRA